MPTQYDFSGWATRSNVLCSDGRTIADNAFADNDGKKVPLVWSHNHDDPNYVLGHAVLENRGDGVYAYCTFNSSKNGQNAKILVENGDIDSLSIYANQLKQNGSVVSHGNIREVSLVCAGANPEAYIENVVVAHGDDEVVEEAIIHTAQEELIDPTPGEIEDQPEENNLEDDQTKEKKKTQEDQSNENDKEDSEESNKEEDQMNKDLEHADNQEENTIPSNNGEGNTSDNQNEKTVKDVYDAFTEEQKTVVGYLIEKAIEADRAKNKNSNSDDQNNSENNAEGGNDMKHNVFEGDDNAMDQNALSHDAMKTIIADAKKIGSLRDSVMEHSAEYGIENIEYLFPDAQKLENVPGFIKNKPDTWVATVMNGVHHTPFSRIKMVFADITADEARAKGYVKGNRKIEEVFTLLRRKVEPTTVYKKQKLDRDDVVDITDFDVVSWLKTEMRMMLDEEIARAILFSDGRSALVEDKIKEANIIPIVKDDSLYTITKVVVPAEGQSLEDAVIDAAVLAKVEYQGSGNTTAFMEAGQLAKELLQKDGFGRRLYKDRTELALAMGVNKIEEVPNSITGDPNFLALIVDLNDYNVGADKGGAVNMFDDFDIDYNQMKYLIETRCSGALTKPYSAIVLKKSGDTPVDPSQS